MKRKILIAALILVLVAGTITVVALTMDTDEQKIDRFMKAELTMMEEEEIREALMEIAVAYDADYNELKTMVSDGKGFEDIIIWARSEYTKLSQDEMVEFYKAGVSMDDILEANRLGFKGQKKASELLDEKVKKDKSWKEIEEQFGIDTKDAAEILGLTKDEIKSLKDKGLTDYEVAELAAMTVMYEVDIKTLEKEYDKENSVEKVKEKLKKDKEAELLAKEAEKNDEKNIEFALKIAFEQYGLSYEKQDKLKLKGIADEDMLTLAVKSQMFKVGFEELADKKAELGTWNKVDEYYGEGN